ncbi:MAG: T9SS type A sorting domain-containing protein [Bacteroidota bacterium]
MKLLLKLICLVILTHSFKIEVVAQDYWRHYDVPYGSFLISQADSKHIVIAGNPEGIYKTVDSGLSWINIHPIDRISTNYFTIKDIAFPNSDLIIATADSSRYVSIGQDNKLWYSAHILRSEDGGVTWAQQSFGATGDTNMRAFSQIIMNDEKNGVIAQQWRDTNRIDMLPPLLRTTDGGITWSPITIPDTNFTPSRVSVFKFQQPVSSPSPGVWFIYGRDYRNQENVIWSTKDAGLNWEKTPSPMNEIQKILFLDSLNGFAIGSKDFRQITIFAKTTDGGQTWITKEFSKDYFNPRFSNLGFNDVDFIDKNIGVIAENFSILKTYDGGLNWKIEYPGLLDSAGWHGYAGLGRIIYDDVNNSIGLGGKLLKYIPKGMIEQPKLITPNIIGPLGGRIDEFAVPGKMWWHPVASAEKYHVQIAKGTFIHPNPALVFNDSSTTNSITISDTLYKTDIPTYEQYFTVRVRSAIADSVSNWSVPVPFFLVKGVTSIIDHQAFTKQPYPNPAHNIIYIPFKSTSESEVSIVISDALGKSINTFKSSYSLSHNAIMLSDLEQLPNGIYFVQISQGKQQQTVMITISK